VPQSLSSILLHIVFSPKNRIPCIAETTRPRLHAYLAGACRAQGCEAFRVGGTEDHVHIACALSRTLAVSQLVEEIKVSSSAWCKAQGQESRAFAWQAGYGAFSLGQSQLPQLLRYIDGQAEHHSARSFQQEFLELLRRYETKCDERYVWD
jgi:REP element-mobilizing transposase RayT